MTAAKSTASRRSKDISGTVIGELVAETLVGFTVDTRADKNGNAIWRFRCRCGQTLDGVPNNVRHRKTKTCGACPDPCSPSPSATMIAGVHDWSWAYVAFRPIPSFPDYTASSCGSI